MATPKELVAAIAARTGIPEVTVGIHDRNLAEAGLRTPALRGRGVSRVTYQDAANLLIAVAGSRNVKDSVKVVTEYGSLVSETAIDIDGAWRGRTLGDAVAALLETVAANPDVYSGEDGDEVDVSLFWPYVFATINFSRNNKIVEKIKYLKEGDSEGSKFETDLIFIGRFSEASLVDIGGLVAR